MTNARMLAQAIADHLAHPTHLPTTDGPDARQSLAHGAPGIALLHIELAAAGDRPWQRAHDWLAYATRTPVTTGPASHLLYGAPAVAHAMACAATHLPGAYGRALDTLNQQITADTLTRVDAAHARIDRGDRPALAEFDLIRGLTGLGSHLLRHDPDGHALRAILTYLVRLTEPLTADGRTLPGWWTTTGPSGRPSHLFPEGHANHGMAHGISGPLALLALAHRRGVTVDGHLEATGRILAWLDRWRTDTPAGPLWPYWITPGELDTGHPDILGPQRPSWCYGTAGVARAQQLAALATGDTDRRHAAEDALARALADPQQLTATTDASLCHGYAGLAHVAARTAADAAPDTALRLRALLTPLLDHVHIGRPEDTALRLLAAPGFLEGAAGVALAATSTTTEPRTGWDTCLLTA